MIEKIDIWDAGYHSFAEKDLKYFLVWCINTIVRFKLVVPNGFEHILIAVDAITK